MKKVFKLIPVVLLLALIIMVGFNGNTTRAANYQVGTYFPNWGMYNAAHQSMNVDMIPWDKVTFINHAFFMVNASYQLVSTDDNADYQATFAHSDSWSVSPRLAGHMGEYRYYKSIYPGVKVVISIGGWTKGNYFHAMAASASTRATFIQSAITFLQTYPFIDGLDFDWEYPGVNRAADPNDSSDLGCPGGPEDTANYTSLLKELRAAYNSNGLTGKLITIAGPGGYDKVDLQQPDIYAQYIDWINVMTYDIHGAWDTNTNLQAALYANPSDPSPTSPIDVKNKFNIDYIMKYYRDTKHVPANKLNLGVPFYSRGWKSVGTNGINGLFATASGAPVGNLDAASSPGGQNSYGQLLTLESTSGYVKYRDSVNNEPYLYNASAGIFYTYDDPTSLGNKCAYVKSNGFGGAFAWEISVDGANFPLMNVLYTNLYGSGPSSSPTPSTSVTPSPTKTPTSTATVTATPTATATSGYPTWNATTAYTTGQYVVYNGIIYQAKWWTQGEAPPGTSGVWVTIGPAGSSSPTSTATSTATKTPTPTATLTATKTPTPTVTPTVTPTATKTPTPTVTVTPTPTATKTVTPTPTPTETSGIAAWAAGVAYKVGDLVTYGGKTYKCLQPHTSIVGWEPSNVPALWQVQ